MQVILRTLIKNKLNTARKLRWCKGWVEAKGSVLLEGAYPTACESGADAQDMQAEIDAKTIEVTLITNLPVGEPVGGVGSILNAPAQAVKVAADDAEQSAIEKLAEASRAKDETQEDESFLIKGTIENHLPEAVHLAGDEGVPPQPEERPIFVDREGKSVFNEALTTTESPGEVIEVETNLGEDEPGEAESEDETEELDEVSDAFDLDAEKARLEAEEEVEKAEAAAEMAEEEANRAAEEEARKEREAVAEAEKAEEEADDAERDRLFDELQKNSGNATPVKEPVDVTQEDTRVSETDFPEMSGAAFSLADELDLTADQINSIEGTGADGRVVKRDVQKYADSL